MAKKYLDNNGLAYFWGKVKDELDDKQDTLTAGTNITIENNVISASGGGGSVDIATNNEIDAIFDEYDTTSVFLLATSVWQETPYCYVWNDTQQVSYKPWYGEAMTLTNLTYNGDPIYKYTYPTDQYDMCIFSQNGRNQTSNLVAEPGKLYVADLNSWISIRTNPLEENKIVSVKGLNEYNTRIKTYIDSVVLDTLGGSY